MRRQFIGTVFALCLSAIVVATVAGCSSATTTGGTSGGSSNTGGMMGGGSTGTPGGSGGMMGGSGSSGGNYTSVGQRIFLTGVGSDGQSIPRTATRVSQGSLMMSGGGCGSCHRANGRGGTIRMMMGTAIKTPDITYGALIKEGFTDATIKRAILDGLDEAGKPLNEPMPRWQMTNADVDATIAYLKTLGS